MRKSLTRLSYLLFFVVSSLGALRAQQSISCPSVNAGPNQSLPCTSPCATLTATNPAGFQTTNYTVGQIPYVPYSYTIGNAIIVNTDDIWSSVLPMPFNFCFYGNVYNSCIVGANGAISFNIANANAFNTWPIAAPIPSATPADMLNSIMAPWHDIDPSVNQSGQTKSIRWQVFGTPPCRTFVVSWFNIPMFDNAFLFGCDGDVSLNATQQIVLYETTNIIETYIAKKRTCTNWNSGAAIHGIQNATGTAAVVVPGRNFPTQWQATNDAWRFVPAGPSNHTIQWFQVGNPAPIASTSSTTVCPPSNTTTSYYAQVVYTNCDNTTITVRDTVQVSIPNGIQSLNPTVVQPNCNALGSISLSPNGGTPGYTYQWSPAAGNVSSISNLSGGTYNVTVTDLAGCTSTQTFVLNPGGRPTATISAAQNIGCNGGSTGSSTVSVVGGTPGYTYAWSPSGGTGATANGLSAGAYSVIVTDLAGCRDTATVTLTQPTAISINLNFTQNVSCNGAADGCLGAAATGGNGNYAWAWSNGDTGDTVCNLPPGNYTVTLTDTTFGTGFLGGFVLCTTTANATITQPSPLTATYSTVSIPCFGGTGCIAANVAGGNGNYSYLWSTGSTLANLCNLAAGTYTVTITDTSTVSSVGGPVVLFNETFEGPLNWVLNVPTGPNGVDNNFWTINDNEGGVLPPGCGVANNANKTMHITSVFCPTCGAAYDAGGLCGVLFCPETNMRAESPAFSSVGFSNLSLSFDFISMGDALLDNASVWYNAGAGWTLLTSSIKTLNCVGGQGQWTGYSAALPSAAWNVPSLRIGINWTNNDDGVGSDPSVAINNVLVTSSSLTGAPVLCTRVDTIVLAQPTALLTTITGHDLSCFGAADGSAVVTHTGGTPGYTVNWSNSLTTDSISGLAAGTYGVTVTDLNGCSSTRSTNLIQPAQIVTGTSMTAVSCNGGADGCAIVTATGGPSGVFSYLWSNGATNDTICGLSAGTYYVTVTDTTGGGGTSNVTIYSEDFDPAPGWTLNVPTGVNGVDNNFWVINDNEGGVLPPGCGVATNGNNSLHITSVFCSTCGAAYDAGGLCGILFCPETNMRAESPLINSTGFSNLVLSFDFISMGDALLDNASVWYNDGLGWTMLNPSIKSINCVGGQGRWTAASFPLPASCWNNPLLQVGINWTNNDDGVGTDPSVAINNIAITSSITTTSSVSCTALDTIVVVQPLPLAVVMSRTNAFCGQPNGAATVTASGGNGGYSYTWSTLPVQTTATATGLAPGAYSVTVTDVLGCTIVGNVNILSIPAPVITANVVTQVLCFGQNNGVATASTTGGTAPITIHWGTIPAQTGSSVSNLAAGTYWVWASDSAGCTDSTQITVTEPALLTVTNTTIGAICNVANGSATATPAGGTPPYSYLWSNGQTTATATNLPGGNVTVTVTDAHGCTATRTSTINQAGSPILALTAYNNITCFGGNDGMVTVTTSAGVGPYTYAWSTTPVQTTPIASNLVAGTYTVTVTDQNGCRDNLTITLTEPTQLQGTIVSTPNGCNLTVPNGTIGAVVSGATPPYSYSWSSVPVQNGPYATGLAPGNYSVTVSDSRGCILVLSGTVGQIPSPTVTTGPDVSFCEGDGGAVILGIGANGTPGYYYNWWCATPPCGLDSIYDNDPLANPNSSQWYYVQVTDTNGCYSNIDSVFVTVLPKPIVDAGPDIILCGEQAPCEIIQPTISGAPGPYTYLWMPSVGLNNPTILNPCARPDTTTIYTLVVTAGNGCTSNYTTTDTLSSIVVHVNPIPVADAGPDRDICYGDSALLQGIATGAGPVYAFEWTPGGDLSDSSVANPLAFPPLTTDYTLVVWSNGCPSYADTATVFVHTIPTVDAGWDREICPLQDTILDANAWGDSTATYSFNWTPIGGIVGSSQVEDPIVGPAQTTTYYVTATTNWGCESAPDSATIYVRPAPQADAGPNFFICPDDTVQLQGGYFYTTPDSAIAGQFYYGWTPAATLSDSTQEDPWAAPSVSTWYTLEIRYSVCSSLDSVLVTVGPQTLAQALPDTTVICARDSVYINASGSFGGNVTWIPSTGLSDPHSLTPTASPDITTTYTLVVGDGGCFDSTSFTIAVLPKPVASYLSSLTEGCAPLVVSFMETAAGGTAYTWNFGDGTPVSNLQQPEHAFTEPGTYNVSLLVAAPGGCTDEVNTITVHVGEGPIAAFGSNPTFPVQMSFPNTAVGFNDLSQGANQWTWDFGDGIVSTDINPVHTYSQTGEFFVTLTVHSPEGCASEVTHGPYIVMTPDLFIPNVFSPNGDGVNDFFQIQYTGDQPFDCTVFDRWGVKLWQVTNKTAAWDGKNGKGDDVADGIYFYVAKVGNRDFNGNVTLLR